MPSMVAINLTDADADLLAQFMADQERRLHPSVTSHSYTHDHALKIAMQAFLEQVPHGGRSR